jgi:hypothetical protein
MEKRDDFRNYGLVTEEMTAELTRINNIEDKEKRLGELLEFAYQQQKLALMNERDAVEEALTPDRHRLLG